MKNVMIIVFVLCVCSSCVTKKQVEYVDRDVVRYVTKVQHDTLVQNVHDSIYHTVFQVGDTVYDTKYVEKVRFRDRVVIATDTLWRDSVVTNVKESVVEKKVIPAWCYLSTILFLLSVLLLTIKFRRL